MSKRQNRWIEQGYTKEQIGKHLEFERYKAKQARERRIKNNLKNKELIERIKNELLGKTFANKYASYKILNINPSVDGIGFWYKVHKVFSDKSEGEFRYFCHFDGYTKDNFIRDIYL